MRLPISGCIMALTACALASEVQDKPAKKSDAEAIVGEWKITHFEEEGEVTPPAKYKTMIHVFAEGKAAIKIDGNVVVEGTLKLDPTKTPKHLDFKHPEEHLVGIYKLDGDKLRLCTQAFIDNTERPKEFKTSKNSGLMLIELERVRK